MALPDIVPIDPILLRSPFDDPDWIYEPKWDGYRGLLYVDEAESYFRSKKNKPLAAFNSLSANARKELRTTSAIFDGEITVLNTATGYSDFDALHRHQGTPIYMAFDLLWHNGQDLRQLRLIERKQLLQPLTRPDGWIRFGDFVPGNPNLSDQRRDRGRQFARYKSKA
jgi:bifunctional non-homologous end joining protein LigD